METDGGGWTLIEEYGPDGFWATRYYQWITYPEHWEEMDFNEYLFVNNHGL